MTIIDLDALTADDVAARLSGSPEMRAAFMRDAAEAGHAEAQVVLGQMLLDGAGVPRDEKAAFGWFRRAASQRQLMAMNMLGRCYDLGWGTAPNKAHAAECYRYAAEQGLDWAMYNYATLLALGDGLPQDRAAALCWLEKAAAMGNAKAINFVGSFHEDGWACERDMDAAACCYARSAEGGDFRGCLNHARMLGAARRIDEACHWLRRAGELGNDAFVGKALAWLTRCNVPEFPTRGVAALREGAGC